MRLNESHHRQRAMLHAAYLTTAWGVAATLIAALATLLVPLQALGDLARSIDGATPATRAAANSELLLWNAQCVLVGVLTTGAGWAMVRGLGRKNFLLYRKGAVSALPLWAAWAITILNSPVPWIAESEHITVPTPALAAAVTLYALLCSRAEA